MVKDVTDKNFVPSEIPDGCTPIHLNLVVTSLLKFIFDSCSISVGLVFHFDCYIKC